MNTNGAHKYSDSHYPSFQEDSNLRTKNNLCKKHMHSTCDNKNCIYSHDLTKAMTCRTFAQNDYCPKADNCDYLHNTKKDTDDAGKGVIICQNFRDTGFCAEGNNCPYKHSKKLCKEYSKGFCQRGGECKDLHEKEDICGDYSLGFCPKGPECMLAQ